MKLHFVYFVILDLKINYSQETVNLKFLIYVSWSFLLSVKQCLNILSNFCLYSSSLVDHSTFILQ